MPVLFIGHGSPMNAIEHNDYTKAVRALGLALPRPRAILCVSAHWMTEGTWVTRMREPRTIHDFYGFPRQLFEVKYPAPGSPEIADRVRAVAAESGGLAVQADEEMWGLDHGTWSVLTHLRPHADVPVLQLSVYLEQPGEYHHRVGQALRPLRDEGVLIMGSGNIVHNLREISWEADARPEDWAVEFDEWVKQRLFARADQELFEGWRESRAGRLSVPTPDHYYPLLTVMGAAFENERPRFVFEGIQNGSISMRSVGFGLADQR